LHAD